MIWQRNIVNSIGMKLALVEPGVFLMGSPPNEADRQDDEHQHEVEITQPFYTGIYPVTQEQYQRVSTNYAAIRPADVLKYVMPLPPLEE